MRAVWLMFTLLCGLSTAQQSDPDQMLKSAIDAQQHGDFQTAISAYRKVLELRPNMVEAKVNLGAALAHEGKFDEAITIYRSALPAVSQKNAVLMNIALAYYKKGDFENAQEQLEPLQKDQPSSARIAVLLGDTYNRLHKPALSVTLLEPLEKTDPQNLDIEYVLGTALIADGKQRDGVTRIEKVAEAGKSAEAYLLAGTTLLRLNEFELAQHDLDAAIRLNPKLPGAYTLAGTAHDKIGNVKEAEIAFREALKQNADDFDANLYLGAILYKQREMASAKTYLERALQLNPSSTMARYEMAMLKSISGETEAAAKDLENVIKDDPNWLEPHVQLASLYYKLHRSDDGARERQIVEKITAEQQTQGPKP
jgi:Flp pilus assembly protein TadD